MKVKFFAKEKPGMQEAIDLLKSLTDECEFFIGKINDPFPELAYENKADLIISYISPWIIPGKMLKSGAKYAINFHPGPPEYPGIGCTNFALYNEETVFGVTAHLMEEKVDTGKIVAVKRFPVYPEDSVLSLTERCYENINLLFNDVIKRIFSGGLLEYCGEEWKRKPYKRAELNELCKLDIEMDDREIKRRVQATYYPGMPGPYINLNGFKFIYNGEKI